MCRPYEMRESSGLAVGADDPGGPRAADSRPYEIWGTLRSSVGAGPRPARGRTVCAPTAKNGSGTLVRKRQAQKRNRSNCNFPHSQAPVGRKGPLAATQILRAGNFLPNLRDNPRNGGSRGPTPPVRGRCRVKRDRGGRDGAHGG